MRIILASIYISCNYQFVISYEPLYETLKKRNISLLELSQMIGCSTNSIGVSIKKCNLNTYTLRQICSALKCNIADVIAQNKRKEFEASLEGKTQTEKGYLKMRYEKELTKPWPLYLFFAKVGISTQTLFAIKNEYGISLSTIDKLCTFFKCQPCDIMEFVKFEE